MALDLPPSLKKLLGPRLKNNTTGFQRAHIIGRDFWTLEASWLSQLGFSPDDDFNPGVPGFAELAGNDNFIGCGRIAA